MIIKDLRKIKIDNPNKHQKKSSSVECPCGSVEYKEKKETFSNGTIHIRTTCLQCGKFIKWLSHAESKIMKNEK